MALVPDQKFSTFQNGGDLIIGDIIVGLRDGLNTRFNYTGELPAGVVVPVDQGGTGATTASQARINLGLGTIAVQDASAVNITGGNADLTTGTIATSPISGLDIVNKDYVDGLINGFTTTATAAGVTVLTVSSTYIQEFTGATTQTVVMPVAATIVAGQSYYIINNSSGNITLQSSGANTILVMAANTSAIITCVLNSGTTAASWNASYIFDNGAGVISITGTANQVIASASTGAITLSLPQSIATSSAVTFASVAFSSTSGIIGTTTNNNAAAGSVGELISSQVLAASGVSLTNNISANVTSISLTAGDWDVYGNVYCLFSTLGLNVVGWISATSATLPDPSRVAQIGISPAGLVNNGLTVPYARVSVASTTTYYLSGYATFATGTATLSGGIFARRAR